MSSSNTLKFEDGAVQFRQRLAVSLLSHRTILIKNIRFESLDHPGLMEHEASFLRLLDKMTNGTRVEINATGTQLRFKPGVLIGGEIEHFCSGNRSIGWFLEGIMPLAPFGKHDLSLNLEGITDGTCFQDPSVDYIKASILPVMSAFGIGTDKDESPPPSIQINQRGAAPNGIHGKIYFFCPIVKVLTPINLVDTGLIKRIRGTVITCRLPPSSAARVAHSAKGLLLRLLPDIWIHTNANTTKQCGGVTSPGMTLVLSAESTSGVILTAECCIDPTQERGAELPEDLGKRGAALLLEEVRRGGCIDTTAQSLILLWMCLGPEDVARVRVGTLSHYTIESLRLFKKAFGVEFKVKPDIDSQTVLLSCLGLGFRNMAKAST
jgi:RNA 3'-terminal phosphate cyclase-like protein